MPALTPKQLAMARMLGTSAPKALPPFPSVAETLAPLVDRFPELGPLLAAHDKNIADWVKSVQINTA